MRFILVILLLFAGLSAQDDCYRIFKNNFKDTNLDEVSISEALKEASVIHPDLLYYFIEAKNSGDMSRFRAARSRYGREKNDWIDKQYRILSGKYSDASLVSTCKALFERQKVNGIDNAADTGILQPGNEEYLDYIVYKFYRKDPDLTFDANMKYKILRQNEESKIFGKLARKLNHKIEETDINDDDVFYLTRYWYILSSPFFAGKYRQPIVYCADILAEKKGIPALFPEQELYVALGYDLNFVTVEETFQGEDMETSYTWERHTNAGLPGFIFGYRYNFSPYEKAFGMVRVDGRIFYSGRQYNFDFVEEPPAKIYDDPRGKIKETYYFRGSYAMDNYFNLGIRLTTPAYYFFHKLAVNAVLSLDYFSYDFKTDYYYDYEKRILDSYLLASDIDVRRETRKIESYKVYPGIGLSYRTRNDWAFSAYADFTRVGFNIGYYFPVYKPLKIQK